VQAAIVNGYKATKERYPWMASLRLNRGNFRHICGEAQRWQAALQRVCCVAVQPDGTGQQRSVLGCPGAPAQLPGALASSLEALAVLAGPQLTHWLLAIGHVLQAAPSSPRK